MASYADGRRDVATWEQFRNAPVGMHLAETVLRTGEPMAAAFCLAVPLGRSPLLAGVLILDSTVDRSFPEDVRRLAAAAGAHLGGVIAQMHDHMGRPTRMPFGRVPQPRSEAAAVTPLP
jgi:hypothetical protein